MPRDMQTFEATPPPEPVAAPTPEPSGYELPNGWHMDEGTGALLVPAGLFNHSKHLTTGTQFLHLHVQYQMWTVPYDGAAVTVPVPAEFKFISSNVVKAALIMAEQQKQWQDKGQGKKHLTIAQYKHAIIYASKHGKKSGDKFTIDGDEWYWSMYSDMILPNETNKWDLPHAEQVEWGKTAIKQWGSILHPNADFEALLDDVIENDDDLPPMLKEFNLFAMFDAAAASPTADYLQVLGHQVWTEYMHEGDTFPVWNHKEAYGGYNTKKDYFNKAPNGLIHDAWKKWKAQQQIEDDGLPESLKEATLFAMFEAAKGKTKNFEFQGNNVFTNWHYKGDTLPVYNYPGAYTPKYNNAHTGASEAIYPVWKKWKAQQEVKPSLTDAWLWKAFAHWKSEGEPSNFTYDGVGWIVMKYAITHSHMPKPSPVPNNPTLIEGAPKNLYDANDIVWKSYQNWALSGTPPIISGSSGITSYNGASGTTAAPPFPGATKNLPKWGPATGKFEKRLEAALKKRLGPYATDSMVKAVKQDMLPVLHEYWTEVNDALVALKMTAAEQGKDVPSQMPGWVLKQPDFGLLDPEPVVKKVPESAVTIPSKIEHSTIGIWQSALSPYMKKTYSTKIEIAVAIGALPQGTSIDTPYIDLWLLFVGKHTKKGEPLSEDNYLAATKEWDEALGGIEV